MCPAPRLLLLLKLPGPPVPLEKILLVRPPAHVSLHVHGDAGTRMIDASPRPGRSSPSPPACRCG
ncbi:hypothetical protein FRAAL5050 [Frankia alni ACN14a]|uniref:Uncharacterized protein n=1 Tax=Frankia alni (strain DSM 45986 / CECT 9034 / ACN14a) TaxID=326424 RepID=Q0RFQ1_FRAAA|nr:hypothetical protein FRAAL5050 [Frankia alni ACN14a]